MDEDDNYNYIINFLKLTFYETEKFTQNNALAMRPDSRKFECVGNKRSVFVINIP